ncbi:MAG TPA: RHS repeat domain-containing protein [Candidatus Brocadiia bacterium]|nr:hypothetical protein [Candidatus Brocadiales bacterium]
MKAISMCIFLLVLSTGTCSAELSDSTQKAFEMNYDFDGNGRLIAIRKPDEALIRYEYSVEGRLLAVHSPEDRTDFKYDRNGNCIEVRNTTGETQYFYNPMNQLTKVSYDYPGMKKSISYEYDPWGRLQHKAVLSANGAEDVYNTYQYDMYGRLQSADVNGLKINYDYDPSSHVVTRTLQNNVKSIYRYNSDGRLSQLDHYANEKNISSFQYTYNQNGNLTKRIEMLGNQTLETDFHYNNTGQITSITHPDGKRLNYKYSAGLLKEIETPTGKMPVNRDTRGLINRIGDTNYLSDNMGRITSVQDPSFQHQYTYDSMGYLKEIKTPKGVMRFDYSAEGLPIRNQWGDQQTYLVPDPMSSVGQPFMLSNAGAYHNVPVPDLSIAHNKPHIEIKLGDGMGNSYVHLTGKFDRSMSFTQSRLSSSQPSLFKIEKVDIPKVESPFHGIKYGKDVQGLIDMGQKLPMPSASRIETYDRYWSSGQYWQDDPYYRNLGLSPQSGPKSMEQFAADIQSWPQEYLQVYGRTLGLTTLGMVIRPALIATNWVGKPWPMNFALAGVKGGVRGLWNRWYGELGNYRYTEDLRVGLSGYDNAFRKVEISNRGARGIFEIARDWMNADNIPEFLRTSGRDAGWTFFGSPRIQDIVGSCINNNSENSLPKSNLVERMFGPFTNLLDPFGNSRWIGQDRSGDHFAEPWERDSKNRRPLGDTTLPGLSYWDELARQHDIQDYLNKHAPKKGTVVEVPGPHGKEYYTSQGRESNQHNLWVAGRWFGFGKGNLYQEAPKSSANVVPLDELRKQYPIKDNPTITSSKTGKDSDTSRYDALYEPKDPFKSSQRSAFPPPFGDGGGGGGAMATTQDALKGLGNRWEPKGVKFDKPAEFYGYLGAIQGVSFDPRTKHLVLIGNGNPKLPPIRMDDFIVALQVIYGGQGNECEGPMFSLEPADSSNPAGDWLTPKYWPDFLEGTHMGDVMLRADWVAKQYSFGVFADYDGKIIGKRVSSVPDFASYIERVKANPKVLSEGRLISRFWIVPFEMTLSKSDNTIIFTSSTMRLEAQRMEITEGGLVDSHDKSDEAAEDFANAFDYDKYAAESPVLEEVREAAKVVAIVKWLKRMGVGVNDYKIDWNSIPKSEGETKKIHSLSIIECNNLWGFSSGMIRFVGGVELKPILTTVPPAPFSKTLDFEINKMVAGNIGTSVAQMKTGDSENKIYRMAPLPLMEGSREMYHQCPVVIHDGITYAADGQKRVRSAFDQDGNTATFNYDSEGRLTDVQFQSYDNWELCGTLSEGGEKVIRIRSPKGDDVTYHYRPDGLIAEIKVNGNPITHFSWSDNKNSVEIGHVKIFEEYPIGDISGKPKKVEKTVCKEKITAVNNELSYVREILEDVQRTEKVSYKYSKDSVSIESTHSAPLYIGKNGDTIVEQSLGKKITYEYEPESGILKKITCENGDYIEFLPIEKRTDGDVMTVRTKKGKDQAEISFSENQIIVREFNDTETIYQYKEGLLQWIDSPVGRCTYLYDNGRLSSIKYPDGSELRFILNEGINVTRLRVQRIMASKN